MRARKRRPSRRRRIDVPEHGQREPEEENKFESEVEGEPVYDADKALDDTGYIKAVRVSNVAVSRSASNYWTALLGKESTHVKRAKTTQYCIMMMSWSASFNLSPGDEQGQKPLLAYRQPLRVIRLAGRKKSIQGVVTRDNEPGDVGQKLAAKVEQDEEEVESHQADGSVGFGNICILL